MNERKDVDGNVLLALHAQGILNRADLLVLEAVLLGPIRSVRGMARHCRLTESMVRRALVRLRSHAKELVS